jgi:hypothetical protein
VAAVAVQPVEVPQVARSSQERTKFEPMKPAPPVTSSMRTAF